MKYWLHPEAEHDLREAAKFYRGKAGASLSQAFFAEFEHAISLLLEHPRLGSIWRFGRRRLLMRRFPYWVIYTLADDQVRILAVAHSSRRPGYWRWRA